MSALIGRQLHSILSLTNTETSVRLETTGNFRRFGDTTHAEIGSIEYLIESTSQRPVIFVLTEDIYCIMSSEPVPKPEVPRGNNARTYRSLFTSSLTNVAHVSAPFITTFLIVHLSAPVVANLGGSSLSSQVMLLGREYYQTPFGETFLLLLPLSIHATSATLKRLVSPRPQRRWTSLLSLTGYASMLFLVPVHFLTHRVNPADASPLVDAIGPSELDYEFVKAGLATWPVRSWALYGALALGVALHAAEGMHVMWNTWVPGAKGVWRSFSKRTRRVLAVASVVPVLTGLFVVSREPLMAFASVADRYRAALRLSFVYRI